MLKVLSQNKQWKWESFLHHRLLLKQHFPRKFVCSSNYTSIHYDNNSDQDRFKPVKLAFDSYQFTKTTTPSFPIIILHGLFGSKSNWKSLSKEIARITGRKIFAVDVRNHGESPHSQEFDYQCMAEDLIYFLQEMNIKKSLLVGHSLGGRIAMFVASNKPELVEKLVIVDVSPISVPHNFHTDIYMYLEAMASSLNILPLGVSLSQARQLINNYLIPVVPDIATRQFLLTNLTELNKEVKWRCNLDAILKNFETGINNFPPLSAKYDQDTLFICGDQSPYVKENEHEKIRNIFSKARFIYVKDAGHWVHSEKPTEFLKVTTEFILNNKN